MTPEGQIALVAHYFAAVDAEDLDDILATLSSECAFSVETHGVQLKGHEEISGMFRRLWDGHKTVRHFDFVHVPDPTSSQIASRFSVENVEHDGRITAKSNCNFFEIEDGQFTSVRVYMTGKNTLESAER